ncbi:MAG: hypothetical protein ABSB86_15340, partial [Bryobacteraceae bacterium]
LTDPSGFYSFKNVPEGPHIVGLDVDRLPTDYEPGPDSSLRVSLAPRGVVRSDFTVVRLIRLLGRIASPPDIPIDDVVIRLDGTNRYTTPDEGGNFSFYNLKEGEYSLTIDPLTIPDELKLSTPESVKVTASRQNQVLATIEFRLQLKPEPEQRIRQIPQQPIHIESAPNPAPKAAPAAGPQNRKKSDRPAAAVPPKPKD